MNDNEGSMKDKFVPALLQSKDKDPNQQFINCTYLKTSVFLKIVQNTKQTKTSDANQDKTRRDQDNERTAQTR